MFSFNSIKSPTHKRCFQSFLHFPSFLLACFQIGQYFLQYVLGSDLFSESQEKKHFRTLLILALMQIFIYMLYHLSTACKIRYCVFFLGRDLLVQESESLEDQSQFEICPVEHSVLNCHQIAISCVSSFSKSVYSFSQIEV